MSHVAIIQSIYDALISSEDLMNKITGVFDFVPEEEKPPYVVVDTLQSLEGTLLDASEREWAVDVHIWSGYSGKKEVLEIADIIQNTLKDEWYFEELMVMRDTSGWFHGIITIRGYERE